MCLGHVPHRKCGVNRWSSFCRDVMLLDSLWAFLMPCFWMSFQEKQHRFLCFCLIQNGRQKPKHKDFDKGESSNHPIINSAGLTILNPSGLVLADYVAYLLLAQLEGSYLCQDLRGKARCKVFQPFNPSLLEKQDPSHRIHGTNRIFNPT